MSNERRQNILSFCFYVYLFVKDKLYKTFFFLNLIKQNKKTKIIEKNHLLFFQKIMLIVIDFEVFCSLRPEDPFFRILIQEISHYIDEASNNIVFFFAKCNLFVLIVERQQIDLA